MELRLHIYIEMNNNYDTDSFDTVHLQSQVRCIHLCGYINEKNEGDEDEGDMPCV